jgi:hypothetical protein
MAEPDRELTVAQRLGQALDRGQLPAGGPAEAAERLIERLERPTRVALMGLPGAGKTKILNLLAGEEVVPEELGLPTLLVQRGTGTRIICTLADGSSRTIEGTNLSEALALLPALVTLELDLPALSVISLLEVAAGSAEADQRRAMAWASKRADIVVWCSSAFTLDEQALWEKMPDHAKDNGFLFLTMTDLLGGRDAVAGVVQRIAQRAGEEFRQILPISAQAASLSVQPDGTLDRTLFRESGAASVIAAIKARVEVARRGDTDTAEALLARHAGPPKASPPRRAPDPVPQVPMGPVTVPEALPEMPLARPVARDGLRPTSRRVISVRPSAAPPLSKPPAFQTTAVPPKPVVAGPSPAPAAIKPLLLVPKVEGAEPRRPRVAARPATPVATIREVIAPADHALVSEAIAALRARTADLAGILTGADKPPLDEVLDHSRATTEALADILGRSSARQIRRIAADLGEVQDLIMLMQLEKGAAPADDALTLILQIQRELETLLAA